MKGKPLSTLGEDYIVETILKWTGKYHPPDSQTPPGDDAYDIPNSNLILSIDGYSLEYSKYEWEEWGDWGWRAITSAISDLVCKGAKPYGVALSLGLNRNLDFNVLEDLYRGVFEALEAYGVYLLGGDTNASMEEAWVTVSAVGLKGDKVLTRFKASPGEYIYTTLENGYGLSGLIWNLHRKYGASPKESVGVDIRLRPKSPVRFVELASQIDISSSVDVSDGFIKSLYLLATSSRVSISLENMPKANKYVEEYGPREGIDVKECIFYGGEDYEVIFTSKLEPDKVLETTSKIGLECMYIGRVLEGDGKVYLNGKEISYGGWDQFRSTTS